MNHSAITFVFMCRLKSVKFPFVISITNNNFHNIKSQVHSSVLIYTKVRKALKSEFKNTFFTVEIGVKGLKFKV